MKLQPCLKRYAFETQRAVPPEETLARVEGLLPLAGITRVADITGLDRIGIPVFSSIRPTAHAGAVSVYNGKGATPAEARVSAMMEGIERFSAEFREQDYLVAGFSFLPSEGVDPADLILPEGADTSTEIPWVRAWDISSDREILVPANAVLHPFPRLYPSLFRSNTNGLASGNTMEEAIFHGLMEVIERDAWSLAESIRSTGPEIMEADVGIAGDLMKKFAGAEVAVRLKNLTSDIGVPTIAAVSDDTRLRDPALLTIGIGTHTNAGIAVLRALTEVAQSRLTQIHGAREDTTTADFRKRMGYDRTKRMNRHWFEADGEVDFFSIRSCDTRDFRDDIQCVILLLRKAGLDRVLVADLTRPEIGVPVVRVIVPGLEVFAMDPERSGKRCHAAQDRHFRRAKSAN
jgi:putative methanogenesis marker protein 1